MNKQQALAFILSSLLLYVRAGLLTKEQAIKIAEECRQKGGV